MEIKPDLESLFLHQSRNVALLMTPSNEAICELDNLKLRKTGTECRRVEAGQNDRIKFGIKQQFTTDIRQ